MLSNKQHFTQYKSQGTCKQTPEKHLLQLLVINLNNFKSHWSKMFMYLAGNINVM